MGAAEEFRGLLSDTVIKPVEVAGFLDGLGHEERVAAVRAVSRGEQRRLYRAVEGFRPLRLVDLVPPATTDLTGVRHYGKNTLPLFSLFEKRFCRGRGADAG